MSPSLQAVQPTDVARAAERLGFVFDRQRGSHAVYRRASDGARLVIPLRGGPALKPKTLGGILDHLAALPTDPAVSPEMSRALLLDRVGSSPPGKPRW